LLWWEGAATDAFVGVWDFGLTYLCRCSMVITLSKGCSGVER